jgi:hypothetical protein
MKNQHGEEESRNEQRSVNYNRQNWDLCTPSQIANRKNILRVQGRDKILHWGEGVD